MLSVLSLILIFALITITTINLNMVIVHAEDDSSLPYCATGEGKDGVSVKICSVDKEKCDKNVKENEISASCKETH
jgi:hypothetical protein